jgi:uncharacterized protein YggE
LFVSYDTVAECIEGCGCQYSYLTGTGKIERKPDVAFVTLYVNGDGILMTDAAKRTKEKVDAVQNAIRANHKGVKSIDVADIQIGEKQNERWGPEMKNEPARPEMTKRIRVTIPPDMDLALSVVDTAIREGAIMKVPSNMRFEGDVDTVIVFGLNESEALRGEVRKKAFDNAKENAQKAAALAERKIGRISAVGCSGEGEQHIYTFGRKEDYPTLYISADPARVEATANVTVSFELL